MFEKALFEKIRLLITTIGCIKPVRILTTLVKTTQYQAD